MSDEQLVRKLCDIEYGLSEWEVDFVENIAKQVLDQKKSLSAKQRARAEEIASKKRRRNEDDD